MAYNVRIWKECRLKVDDGNGGTEWKDFQEEDLHVPLITSSTTNISIDSSSSNLLYTFNDWTPKKGLITEEMELPIDYNEFLGIDFATGTPKYLYVSYMGNNHQKIQFYAWIDSAHPVANKGPNTNTRIRYHINWWHTMLALEYVAAIAPDECKSRGFTLGAGRIKRGPEDLARPDPGSPRLWEYDSSIEIKRSGDEKGPWIIVHYTKTIKVTPPGMDEQSYTRFYIAFWGVQESTIESGGVTYYTIPLSDVYNGMLEEDMGIAASSIIGVYFSPVPPVPETIIGFSHYSPSALLDYGWHNYAAGVVPPETYHITFGAGNEIKTTDHVKYVITDPIGTVYGTLPWGQEADRVVASVDVGSSGAWLNLEFKNGAVSEEYGEGRKMQLPLISAPVTSNALSEYVLSGQQEYDRTMARIQQEQNLKAGVAGIGSSIIGGAVAGTVAAPGIGTIAGAAAGPALGGIGLAANYFIQGETDRKTQEATYNLMANQVSNVLISGGGSNWWYHGLGIWRIVCMIRDPTSDAELTMEQEELGYVTDCYVTDCSPALTAGGPFKIEDLKVKGDVCPAAKQYIAALFARGVHLDLIP